MSDTDIIINLRAVTRASRSEIVGLVDDVLKVRVAAPPVNGAANAELIKLLAKTFGVAKTNVEITAGETSRNKRVRITGAAAATIQHVLRP